MQMGAPDGYKLERRWSFTHFLIGVFGALAILGVMAKIFNFEAQVLGYPLTWKPVVLVGFMGEAFVFILMGMLREFQYVPVDEEESVQESTRDDETRDDDAQLGIDLQDVDTDLTRETEQLAEKTRETRMALQEELDALKQLRTLRSNLQDANETLSKHSQAMGTNMEDLGSFSEAQASMNQSVHEVKEELLEESEQLTDEIADVRRVMETLRSQFAQAARRFEQFNVPATDSEPTDSTSNSAQ